MADLIIREEDGWLEISDLVRDTHAEFKKELWGYAAAGDVGRAQNLLDMELGSDLEDLIGMDGIESIRMVAVPDDRVGDLLRVWIKRQDSVDPAPPEGGAEEARVVDIERELDRVRTIHGPLKAPERTRLRAVLYQPTEKTWDDAYTIVVGADRWTTLWQAVIAVDPTFPQRGPTTTTRGKTLKRWAKIPSQETLLKALRYATH